MKRVALAAALLALPAAAQPTDPPEAARHVAEATKLAGTDLTAPLFLCRPRSASEVLKRAMAGQNDWLEPVRMFDTLSYIGNSFVGVFVIETSDGLILIDSLNTGEEAEMRLVPGLRKLGLDPARIKYVLVTHGHFDHYGGAAWLQRTYGARVALSAEDWDLMARLPADAPEINGRERPKRDIALTDGQTLTLGETTLTVHVTPGHTPGTLAALVPVRHRGTTHTLSLMGGTAFPDTVGPSEKTAGVAAFAASMGRLADLSKQAGAVGLLNTHAFVDGNLERMAAVRKGGDSRAFLIGTDAVERYYRIVQHCLKAAEARLK